MIKIMRQYEEKIKKQTKKQFQIYKKWVALLNTMNMYVILVVENKSECETINSQIECSVKNQQTFIQNYDQYIAEQNEKVKPLSDNPFYNLK
ncbi:hypothetical protein TTHERM_01353110 (macronuclear) [Tetrahymena thermophila SB210]|uniref:Uncharacterized protein n=1 Tax=Tetrahymena thermophila (strain SB210) TaxID=312017 RepID=Q23KN6_TETTS|nr:hypothetical protein TTHERM_01353110 [Tetrahymena thermophila SB210]EAR97083.2 hypothetical protein TTHERM_01353110 [Tetrahymena thermophila SB210]|eukprot:XP_001017328.2 hypothetical protein TTHERM_01353110 [Tetrahymena thermophila SB210]